MDQRKEISRFQVENVGASNSQTIDCWQRFFPSGIKGTVKRMVSLAIPVIITNLFQFTIPLVAIIMCGQKFDKIVFDGVSLAVSMINGIGLSTGLGLSTACDTLFAQAYGSADKKRTGMFLQRSIYIISLAPFFILSILINMEPIFILLGQQEDISMIATKYLRFFTPGLFFNFNYLILARFMQNQDRVFPPVIAGIIGNLFNTFCHYICIYQLELGYQSSAVCQAATYFIMWLVELIYILVTKLYKNSWDGWKSEAFYDWTHFLKLAIPGVGHVALETLCWEATIFISGIFGATELAAQTILCQTETTTFMIPLGMGVAVNIMVGQALGNGDTNKAKTTLNVSLILSLIQAGLISIVYLSLMDYLPYIFTNDEHVAKLATSIIPIMSVIILTDNISGAAGGALRGCGQQNLGALMIFLGYYVLGMPIALVLAFANNMSLMGLWVGITTGIVTSTFGYLVIFKFQNWNKQVENARKRIAMRQDFSEIPVILDETTNLLSRLDDDVVVDATRLNPRHGHVRTPSQPYTCSTEYHPMPTAHIYVTNGQFRTEIIKKTLILLFSISFFISAIILSIYLPKEWYMPIKQHNYTISVTIPFNG